MGIVYRALEPSLERRVAIKSLHAQMLAGEEPETAREHRLRFLQEARAAAALSHPGAATIYRIGEEDGTPYIAMEWLEGKTLEKLIQEEGKLAPERAVRLMIDLLGTLDAAHRNGVVHRDVKPANLVLLPDGRLKVTDFGIARLKGSDLVKTQAGFVLATPRFASPEQLRGEDVDGRSDLFAAGILLFHLLTGRYPVRRHRLPAGGERRLPRSPHPPAVARPDALPRARRGGREGARQGPRGALRHGGRDGRGAGGGAPSRGRPTRPTRTAPAAALPPRCATCRRRPSAPPSPPSGAGRRGTSARRPRGRCSTGCSTARCTPRRSPAPPCWETPGCCSPTGWCWGPSTAARARWATASSRRFPSGSQAMLYPVPEALGAGCVRGLASLLHPPRLRHEGLDSSYVNLAALAGKLLEERFDGALRLRRSDALGTVVFDQGRPVLSLFSKGWDGVPVERPWDEWVSGLPLRADVEERRQMPVFLSFQRELRNTEARRLARRPRRRRAAGGRSGPPLPALGPRRPPGLPPRARPRDEVEVPRRVAGRRAPGAAPPRPAADGRPHHGLLRPRHLRRGRPRAPPRPPGGRTAPRRPWPASATT